MQSKLEKPTSEDFGTVLIVDDDPQIRLLIARFLERYGYEVVGLPDGRTLEATLAKARFDLVILDIMLPGSSGLDLCRAIRQSCTTPVMMLTARGRDDDRIVGFEAGADDYLPKPFNPLELLARTRAILRRSRPGAGPERREASSLRHFDGWMMDLRKRELTSPQGMLIELSTGEFDLLAVFVDNPNRALTREALMEMAKTRAYDSFDR